MSVFRMKSLPKVSDFILAKMVTAECKRTECKEKC
jgi:hypothetical protein